jgi:hypothetical protein
VNKENIFEELNKMRNLMVAKAGTVISEQANPSADVGTVMRELDNFNTNEQAVVNIIKKYKTMAELQNFFNQFKTISGKDFGNAIGLAFKTPDDNKEIADLRNHLKTVGAGLEATRQGWTITGLTAQVSAADAAKVEEMWKDPKVSCVVNQPSAKKETVSNGSIAYLIGPVRYYANGRKQLADGSMTSYSCATEFKSGTANSGSGSRQGSSSVNTRFVDSAKSLGIQGDKMDLQTLQSILKTLEGGQSTPAVAATATQGTPDLAQLTAALNQLNA